MDNILTLQLFLLRRGHMAMCSNFVITQFSHAITFVTAQKHKWKQRIAFETSHTLNLITTVFISNSPFPEKLLIFDGKINKLQDSKIAGVESDTVLK
jgi:hypothetical protein